MANIKYGKQSLQGKPSTREISVRYIFSDYEEKYLFLITGN